MRLLLILTGLFIYSGSFPQKVQIFVSTDKKNILIGEQFTLNIKILGPASSHLTFIKIDSFSHFEILNYSKIDSLLQSGNLQLEQHITLTSWDSGQWTIPSISFAGSKTRSIPIKVSYSSFDPSQPYHDIKDIINVKKTEESNWYWYLIGVLFFAALFFLFFEKGNKREKIAPVTDENAYKVALKKIEQLKKEMSDDSSKVFYTRLIDIFREYVWKRKNIQSFSKTTEDLISQINKFPVDKQQLNELIDVFLLSDMVKFAQFQPSGKEKLHSMETIKTNIVTLENLQ